MACKAGLRFYRQMAILRTDGTAMPQTVDELLAAKAFANVVDRFLKERREALDLHDVPRLEFDLTLRTLCHTALSEAQVTWPAHCRDDERRGRLHEVAEELYDFWRSFERFLVLIDADTDDHRGFKDTINHLNHLVRKAYREICENITAERPRVYRQVAAGFQVGIIARPEQLPIPPGYGNLAAIPRIRQVLLNPPLVIDPPETKRTGEFARVTRNPLHGLRLPTDRYLMYPARVGDLLIFIYFHDQFIDLGCALSNLFELASDEECRRKPDAIYVYGAPAACFADGDEPTIFHEDDQHNVLTAAVPLSDRYGYFGYLKKMVLTLHNIIMMKRGRMPAHGAFVRLRLRGRDPVGVLLIGDTGAGKSESIEAFRALADASIQRMTVVFDDMGSLEETPEGIVAYGTEIGAFVRLDDLSPGYALGNIDRSIIMNPHKTNARLVIPITSMRDILHGHRVDYLLYANNFEHLDAAHPILERFTTPEAALAVFREGTAMSKGTTTHTGLTHAYFANIFGPSQYKELHEGIATRMFAAAFRHGVFVGQLRTRLGIAGYATEGPRAAAAALLELLGCQGATPNAE